MPLFGSKKEKKIDMPEVVDFSNDTWSFKGVPPVYQIQSDGFSYDIVENSIVISLVASAYDEHNGAKHTLKGTKARIYVCCL